MAVRKDGHIFPCGQCKNCRINRKREWQSRLLLEAAVSKFSAFITLTLEAKDAKDGTYCTYLDKRVVQLFLKRLRDKLPANSLRYLVVGEYGEKRGRAHYHALMFSTVPLGKELVSQAWGLGNIDIGDVQQESIDYCLAYVLKARSDGDAFEPWDQVRRSRHGEFRLHSQGLGKAALLHLVAPAADTGELLLNREYRVLGRSWPIGRYLRNKYRGGTATALRNAGISDPVRESDDVRIERLLFEKLFALPPGTPAYAEVRQKILQSREEKMKQLKARNIRDYYKSLHQLTDRGRKNETF